MHMCTYTYNMCLRIRAPRPGTTRVRSASRGSSVAVSNSIGIDTIVITSSLIIIIISSSSNISTTLIVHKFSYE